MKVGDIVLVKVTGIADYGFFIEKDGYTGLCHISEVSNNFVEDVSQFVSVGEEIYVLIPILLIFILCFIVLFIIIAMKKKLLILPIILFLTGCSNNKLNIETADNRQEVLKINHDYFEKNINEKKDFIILISLSTCLNCLKVKSILNDYIKEKNKLIYEIELNEYTSIDSSIFYYPIDHTPLLVFIKEGNVVDEKQKNLIDKDEVFNLLNSKIN